MVGIDYTNLNKECLVHPYPLPRINDLINETPCFEQLSFLDALLGHDQIPLDQPVWTP